MTQAALKRVHIALDQETFDTFTKLALASALNKKITVGALVAAAVFCLIDKMEANLTKKKQKAFTVNKTKINPNLKEKVGEIVRMHVYFGKQSDLIDRVQAVATNSGQSVGWVVRESCHACAPVFKKMVPKGKTFKCVGKSVTID